MTINFYGHFVIENNLVSYLYLEYFCIFNFFNDPLWFIFVINWRRKIFTFLDNIKNAGERAANIVTNMLEFSRTHTNKHARARTSRRPRNGIATEQSQPAYGARLYNVGL